MKRLGRIILHIQSKFNKIARYYFLRFVPQSFYQQAIIIVLASILMVTVPLGIVWLSFYVGVEYYVLAIMVASSLLYVIGQFAVGMAKKSL